jgi:light-regulated signal transduction histidine kinase (bacteriophytochrome)
MDANTEIAASSAPLDEREPNTLLYRLIRRMQQSLELPDILQATVAEVQVFLGIDRIKIYQFHPDGSGQVVAEHLDSRGRLPSLFGLNFPADDIPPQTRTLYIEAKVRTVVDVESRQIGQARLRDPQTGHIIDEAIAYRPLDPCHAEYLTTMGVRSSIVSPILVKDTLWGLIVGHHSEPKEISLGQLNSIQLVIEQLALAIMQATEVNQTREKAARKTISNQVNHWLNGLPTLEIQAALEATVKALDGVGGRLFLCESTLAQPQSTHDIAQLYEYGCQPILHERANPKQIERYQAWQEHFNRDGYQPWTSSDFDPQQCQPWAIDDVHQVGDLRTLQSAFRAAQIRGLLIVPLQARQQIIGYLSIFRTEVTTAKLWAGEFDPDNRQEFPRQSFAVWQQTKTNQAHPWQAHDITWVNSIGQYFATALERAFLHQQIQAFNATLELQVQERTAELHQALNDLQQTQSHLIQAEKMSSLGQLVAGIAHEINNPINFIHGNLLHVHNYAHDLLNLIYLYQCQPLPEAEINQALETFDLAFASEDLPKVLASMRFGTERIREIVLSLRNFSRLDQADLKAVNIHEGIDSTLMILQHRLKANSDRPEISLLRDYGDLPAVECYAGLMNQVFMNLVSNAIDAIEAAHDQRKFEKQERDPDWQPEIIVSTALLPAMSTAENNSIPAYITISIIDNGQGMSEAIQKQLFNPFFTTKPVGKGTGLGLSLSYQIVTDRHHGSLTCDSTLQHGTKFQVKIPLIQTV